MTEARTPTTPFHHRTVMLDETLAALSPRSGGLYADATLGGGGHTEGILRASAPDGRVIGIDRDPAALEAARERLSEFAPRVTFVHGAFASVAQLLAEVGEPQVDGLIADIAVDKTENVFPMIPSGAAHFEMLLGPNDQAAKPISEEGMVLV